MDKNTIIGILLIGAVIIGFSIYNQPSEEQIKAQQELLAKQEADKKKAVEQQKAAQKKQEEIKKQTLEDTTALFHQALTGSAENIVLKNDKLELTINSKGGTVTKAVIKDYKSLDGAKDVTIFDEKDQSLSFKIDGKEQNINTGRTY